MFIENNPKSRYYYSCRRADSSLSPSTHGRVAQLPDSSTKGHPMTASREHLHSAHSHLIKSLKKITQCGWVDGWGAKAPAVLV